MQEDGKKRGMISQPSQAEVERYTELYIAQLSTGSTQEWEQLQDSTPPEQVSFYDDLRQKLRSEFHANHALERRKKLSSLLAQTPPFSHSQEDERNTKTKRGQSKRYLQVQQFIKGYANRSAVGVHPFFASLKRLLEYQGSGNMSQSCQWLLDDAVLMETGGDDWMESVVWILKGVLLFTEEGSHTEDPFVDGEESIRKWTVSTSITDPECRRLSRLVPSYVLPRKGSGSQPIQRIVDDEETLKDIEMPTGRLRISDTFRNVDYRGSLLERLWNWLLPRWYQ